MLDEALRQLTRPKQPSVHEGPPGSILVDLREVAGYESGLAHRAVEWLRSAHHYGVRRIAFLASSAVLRTAIEVAARTSAVKVRMFEHEANARQWLSSNSTHRSAAYAVPCLDA